jgi:hypothetical protein
LGLTFWEKGAQGSKKPIRAFDKEGTMAANQTAAHNDSGGHPDMDYAAHFATYRLFTTLLKWGATGVVLALVLLAFLTL